VDRLRGFRQGLKETGYSESETATIEYRWAENQLDRLPALAADLARRRVAVIIASGGADVVFAAKGATTTIPILFIVSGDPVKLGLVTSLARPDRNLTGINFFNAELAKRLEILRELVPGAKRVVALVNPSDSRNTETTLQDLESAAPSLGQARQPPRAVISRWPSTSAGSPRTPRTIVPSSNLTFPTLSPGGSLSRMPASPAAGTDQISTASLAPVPSVTRSIAGCSSLMLHSR
jgi:hypothetical protein